MDFDDSLHQCQPDASPITAWVEFIEQAKDPIKMLRLNAHPVVADVEDGFATLCVFTGLPDLNAWIRLGAHELGGIVQQILQHFQKP